MSNLSASLNSPYIAGRIRLIMATATLFAASLLCHAGPLEDFHREYPKAAAQLQEAYTHVRIEDRKTTRDNRRGFGGVDAVEQEEFLRDGEMVRYVHSVLESADPDKAVGIVTAAIGDAENNYTLVKPDDNAHFVITRLRGIRNYETSLRLQYQPLFASYCLFELRVLDYLKDPSLRITAANRTQVDGAEAVELLTENRPPNGDVLRDRFLFDRRSWALLGWSHAMRGDKYAPAQQAYMTCKATYNLEASPPKLRSLQYWLDSVPESKKPPIYTYDVSRVEFGQVPSQLFTVQAFGVEEPAHRAGRSNRILIMVIASAILLGLLFLWLARQYRRDRTGPAREL